MTNKQNSGGSGNSDSNSKRSKPYHNEYFISIFTISVFLKSFLKAFLDFEVSSALDWDAMIIDKESFKGGRSADIVCSVPLVHNPAIKVKVVIIIEHKSKYEKTIYEQMLKYQTLMLDRGFKENNPTPVLVLVFYHGKTPWIWPTSFQKGVWGDLKIPGKFLDNVLDFNMIVVDTNSRKFKEAISRKDLLCSGSLNLMSSIWGLKEVKFDDFVNVLSKFTSAELSTDEVVSDSVSYIWSYSKLNKSDFVKLWNEVEFDLRSKGILKKGGYMNIRERIKEECIQEGIQKGLMQGIQKGRQEGIQEGIREGKQEGIREGLMQGKQEGIREGKQEGIRETAHEIVLNMIKNKLSLSTIVKVTGLSEKEVEGIKSKLNGSSHQG